LRYALQLRDLRDI